MGGAKKNSEIEFKLPNEIVKVKFIPRRKGMASGDHVGPDHVISGGMLENAVRRFTVPLLRNGSIKNILTDTEKEYLEKKLGTKLSVYSDFWKNRFVTLRKYETLYDLNLPDDFIDYKILESNKTKIVIGWENKDKNLTYDFVIVRDGEETKANKKSYDVKKLAWKEYSKIESEYDILIGLLKLLSKRPISRSSKMDWIQNEVERIVDERPKDFISIVKSPSFTTKLLLNRAVELGVVIRSGNKYNTADGIELAEKNMIPIFDNAVDFLDNPKHQDVRSMIQAKMSNAEE